MERNNFDPGGGPKAPSYAQRVKKNNYKKLDRNVLNISIEKRNQEDVVFLNGDQVASVCAAVGISVSCETQGYQAHYRPKVITLSVWAKPGVSLERFVSEQPREFTSDLIISSVRPAVRREVSVLVTGLHFNTPDAQVKEYIECFGAKVSGEPRYGVHREGPWKGQFNGDRRFTADFTGQTLPMGTYHLVDGAKVKVMYPGNTRTCGRCHQAPSHCPGGGIARECGEQGGHRVPLIAHMRQLWDRVGFIPGAENGQGAEDEEEDSDSAVSGEGSRVTAGEAREEPESVIEQLNLVPSGVAASGEGGSDTAGGLDEEGESENDAGPPLPEAGHSSKTTESELPGTLSQGTAGEFEGDITLHESPSSKQDIFPSIQQKVEIFETEDMSKRKAETSPELSKKEKKKQKNQEKQLSKQQFRRGQV